MFFMLLHIENVHAKIWTESESCDCYGRRNKLQITKCLAAIFCANNLTALQPWHASSSIGQAMLLLYTSVNKWRAFLMLSLYPSEASDCKTYHTDTSHWLREWQKVANLHIQQLWSKIFTNFESNLLPPDDFKPHVSLSFSSVCGLHQLLRGNTGCLPANFTS